MTDNIVNALEIRLALARPGFTLDVDLHLPGTGITVIFGASGCGKTSLLRAVAGLERPQHARIIINGDTWHDDARHINQPTWRRPLGYVFQEASLFTHLSVKDNLEYGIKRRPSANATRILADAVDLLGIGHLLHRDPDALSGGERQRVAIARALATRPRLLLLDEPLASLDPSRREEVLPWLEKLHDEFNLPMLYVTHSTTELQRLADHVVVLEQGRAITAGPVDTVLASTNPALFTGDDSATVLTGRVDSLDATWNLATVVSGTTSLQIPHSGLTAGQQVRLLVLARDVSITLEPPLKTSIQNQIPCCIDAILPDTHPAQMLVRLSRGSTILTARITRKAQAQLGLAPGQHVYAQVKSVALVR